MPVSREDYACRSKLGMTNSCISVLHFTGSHCYHPLCGNWTLELNRSEQHYYRTLGSPLHCVDHQYPNPEKIFSRHPVIIHLHPYC